MDDGVGQSPRTLTACPKCQAPFYLGQAALDGRWLCVACRAEVSGTDPSARLRWLYPLSPSSHGGGVGSDSELESGHATWAPLLRGALGDGFIDLFESVYLAAPLEAGRGQQAMVTDLSGLELFERSRPRRGRHAQGRQVVEDFLVRHAALDEAGRAEARQSSRLLRELAVAAAEQGDAEAAMGYARCSVAVARWPELEQDRIAAADGWRALGLPRF
jgi:hypothetical protein